jgi:hypothetical protein
VLDSPRYREALHRFIHRYLEAAAVVSARANRAVLSFNGNQEVFDVPEYDFDELGYMNGVGYLTWGAAVRKYKSLPPAVRGPIFLRPSGSLYKPSDFDRAAEQL